MHEILFLCDNFPPEVNAPANRTFEHCREWVKDGDEVTVITCAPNFPQGKVYEGYRNKFYQTEMMEGIKVIRVWSYISANKGFIKRIIDYISFAFMAFWASLFVKTDIIVATSPQFFTAVAGYFSGLFKQKPWIMEVRDLWPESIKAVDAMNQNSKLIVWLEKVELFLYRKAKNVIVVTDAFKKNLIDRNIEKDKIFVVKNGVNLADYDPMPKEAALLQELHLEDKFVVGYLGTHGLAHKLDFILQSAQNISDKDIHFLFIGDGAEKEKLIQMKAQLTLENVTMLSSVPKKEINRYLSIADIALVPLKKSETFKTVIPSKIFESAAMKRPILLGVEGESKELIERYEAGICFEPENEKDFIEKLLRIKQDKDLYTRCQEGCQVLGKYFDRTHLAKKMRDIITATLTGQKTPTAKYQSEAEHS